MSEAPLSISLQVAGGAPHAVTYRGTSLIINTPLLGPYSRTIPRVLWWS